MHFIERLVVISKNNVVSDQDIKEQLNENAFETNYIGEEAETTNHLQPEKEQIFTCFNRNSFQYISSS